MIPGYPTTLIPGYPGNSNGTRVSYTTWYYWHMHYASSYDYRYYIVTEMMPSRRWKHNHHHHYGPDAAAAANAAAGLNRDCIARSLIHGMQVAAAAGRRFDCDCFAISAGITTTMPTSLSTYEVQPKIDMQSRKPFLVLSRLSPSLVIKPRENLKLHHRTSTYCYTYNT